MNDPRALEPAGNEPNDPAESDGASGRGSKAPTPPAHEVRRQLRAPREREGSSKRSRACRTDGPIRTPYPTTFIHMKTATVYAISAVVATGPALATALMYLRSPSNAYRT
jgi:hypothetical protein